MGFIMMCQIMYLAAINCMVTMETDNNNIKKMRKKVEMDNTS